MISKLNSNRHNLIDKNVSFIMNKNLNEKLKGWFLILASLPFSLSSVWFNAPVVVRRKKRIVRNYTQEEMEEAMKLVLSGQMNVSAAANKFNLPKETLRLRVVKKRAK